VEGITFCQFDESDVVRHPIVQRIVRAYDSAKPRQQELPLQGAIEVGGGTMGEGDEDQQAQPTKPQ